MEIKKAKSIIESILFSAGRPVQINELVMSLEMPREDVINIIESMKNEFKENERGIEIIKVNEAYQFTTKRDNYEYIYSIVDKRSKPNLSQAALETLAIIAYNPLITRAEIESIRGVNSDGTIYRLLEHNIIEDAGKSNAPGKPTTYKTTDEFLKLFGFSSLEELPELPKYKLDENQQIVIDDIMEVPEPAREENVELKNEDSDNVYENVWKYKEKEEI